MDPATQIALAATLGNLLQGWDNGAIAGALLYLKPELGIQGDPILEGIVVGSTLFGALLSTIVSGPGSDWLGRRAILIVSAIFYTISSVIMLWSPTVTVLIIARLLIGSGLGIAVTVVPIYIAETAPAESRGKLLTLPQFMGSGGLFMAYTLCFFFSLGPAPNWRIMLALIMAPSLLFATLAIFYLPESPRWLVSKGKMLEAKTVLQRLRNKADIAGELALLVEGLGVGTGASLEEWVIEPAKKSSSCLANGSSQHVLYTPEEGGAAWIAKSLVGSNPTHSSFSHAGASFVDPVVSLIGSLTNTPNVVPSNDPEQDIYESDFDKGDRDVEEAGDDAMVGEIDDLNSPLLRRRGSSKAVLLSRQSSIFGHPAAAAAAAAAANQSGVITASTPVVSAGIGSGWQLAWEWDQERGAASGEKNINGEFRRVYLLQDGAAASQISAVSALSLPSMVGDGYANGSVDQSIQAAALIGKPAQSFHELVPDAVVGPAMVHPAETAIRGPAWSDLLEVGVRRALVVGIVLQILQQFSGINAVLYFVPQILQQSGAGELLSQLGLGSESASILASGVTCLIMLPCIGLAMRLMDVKGRRQILLYTLPVLVLSLITMVISSTVVPAGVFQAISSFIGVTVYVCVFVMGFGPIPNILGSEIFPTRVRGVCIGMCQASMWTCNILLTNMFPTLLKALGIGGLFGCFGVVVSLAWVFTFFKVPETKGMPLEIISEFFAMNAS